MAAAGALVAIAVVTPGSATTSTWNSGSHYTDEVSDYGVCRGPDPDCYHDWGNFGSTTTSRCASSSTAGPPARATPTSARPLGPGLNPPLNADTRRPERTDRVGSRDGLHRRLDRGRRPAPRRASVQYNAVIFLSTNRDTLDDTAQTDLRQYIRGGGGFVGIHNAFGTEYNWQWYEGLLGGANYYDHGAEPGRHRRDDHRRDASTAGLPRTWTFTDEWYNLVPFPSRVRGSSPRSTSHHGSTAPRDSGHPGHGTVPPGHLVPVLRRRPGLADHARPRREALDRRLRSPGDEYFKQHVVGGI